MEGILDFRRLVLLEHAVNKAVLDGHGLPGTLRGIYGALRSRGGRYVYASPFFPDKASPNVLIARLLKPGDVYIDVGANEGHMATIARAAVGRTGQVHAFEPRTSAWERLLAMREAYGFDNMHLYCTLVGEAPGSRVFHECAEHPSSSSLMAGWAGGTPCERPMVSLDAWAAGNHVDRAELLKIDVEGAEAEVLKGAREFLRAASPCVILEIREAEKREELYGYSLGTLFDLLRDAGLTAFYCPRKDGLHRISGPEEVTEDDADMFAVHLEGQRGKYLMERLGRLVAA
jgi:FkbM family methyltransferase